MAVPSSHPQYTLSPKVVAEEGAEVKADDKAQYTDDPLWGLILALDIEDVSQGVGSAPRTSKFKFKHLS